MSYMSTSNLGRFGSLPRPAAGDPEAEDRPLSLAETCERFNLTKRALNYYEYLELLSSTGTGRRRRYDRRAQTRLRLICRGRRFGFTLEELRRWLDLYDAEGPGAQRAAWIAMAERRLGELEAQRREFYAAIADLRKLRDRAIEDHHTSSRRET